MASRLEHRRSVAAFVSEGWVIGKVAISAGNLVSKYGTVDVWEDDVGGIIIMLLPEDFK